MAFSKISFADNKNRYKQRIFFLIKIFFIKRNISVSGMVCFIHDTICDVLRGIICYIWQISLNITVFVVVAFNDFIEQRVFIIW